ncbi:MAG: TIM barrel protein [Candidatus Hydrogenedentes bacterium]|nr:TIM barrel protein [Candidatus Hydrogenedentota bacterium]
MLNNLQMLSGRAASINGFLAELLVMNTMKRILLVVCVSFFAGQWVASSEEAPTAASPGTAAGPNGAAPWEPVIAEWKSKKDHKPASNSYCYVCHLNYQKETFAQKHKAAGVGCETCHGVSDKHSEDEDNVTPPDVMYPKEGIAPLCAVCHPNDDLKKGGKHDALFTNPAAETKACMECHGEDHRLKVRTRKWDKQTGKLAWDDGVRMMKENPGSKSEKVGGIFAKDNLVAWCIVPFDAKKRGPVERADMLKRLGFSKFAYDWRDEHVPSFDQEIVTLKEHGIEFFAFWGQHEEMFKLFEKHKISPQVWMVVPSPPDGPREQMVEAAAKQLLPLVERTRQLGCKLGLYNHGGWGGEPRNMAAVCEWLQKNAGGKHVGIVYNFHHGHADIGQFRELFALMKPYLLCVNLNGMNADANPLILPIGQGQHEKDMMRVVVESGYKGPIGILGHRAEVDAEEALRQNLEGLDKLAPELLGKPVTGAGK